MDLNKLKQFVKQNRDHKFIFVENGEPDLVVMSFAEYERLISQEDEVGYSNLFQAGAPELQPDLSHVSVPEQTPHHREFPRFGRSETVGLPVHLEDIRLEDLPV